MKLWKQENCARVIVKNVRSIIFFLGESNIRIYFGNERNETEILRKDQVEHSVVA